MSATQRPWAIVDRVPAPAEQAIEPSGWVDLEGANQIFVGSAYGHEHDQNFVNAELIVLAVNSHDELVALLEAMLADDELVLSGVFHDRARAALAKARGEPS